MLDELRENESVASCRFLPDLEYTSLGKQRIVYGEASIRCFLGKTLNTERDIPRWPVSLCFYHSHFKSIMEGEHVKFQGKTDARPDRNEKFFCPVAGSIQSANASSSKPDQEVRKQARSKFTRIEKEAVEDAKALGYYGRDASRKALMTVYGEIPPEYLNQTLCKYASRVDKRGYRRNTVGARKLDNFWTGLK